MGIFFEPNITFAEGGGITSKIIPYRLTKVGIGAGFGIGAAASLGSEMLKNHNRLKMGPVKYTGGPDRMTHNVTSGAVEAISKANISPQEKQAELTRMMRSKDTVIGNLEEYGVNEQFMSAFYGMNQ